MTLGAYVTVNSKTIQEIKVISQEFSFVCTMESLESLKNVGIVGIVENEQMKQRSVRMN